MMQQVLADERFTSLFPDNPATGKKDLDEAKAAAEMVRLSPLCCFLGDESMHLITATALSKQREQ